MSELAAIEQDVRISKSKLWDLQSRFYKEHGIEFWRERASFTSANPLVVSASVDLLLSFLKDQRASANPEEPFYIVELGTGSGCFAYRFLQEFLFRIDSSPELSHLNVRYVMTDFIPEIVSIWLANPFLKSFVENGKLDFAVFDPSCEQTFTTTFFAWRIEPRSFANPPIFIANALFDTIGVDGFSFSWGEASEIVISTDADSEDPMSSLIANTLTINQKVGNPVRIPYYDNPDFELVLKQYVIELHRGVVSIPIKPLEILNNLRALTNSRLALLVCSRGFTDIRYAEEAEKLNYNDLSFPLNFDALKKYFAITGGELLLPENLAGEFITRCLAFGFFLPQNSDGEVEQTRSQYPSSASRLMQGTEAIQNKISRGLKGSKSKSTIASVIDIVSTAFFDPPVFLKCIAQSMDAIEAELPKAPEAEVKELLDMLHRVDRNVYTFDREIPPPISEDDVFTFLIRVWQRASAAHHQSIGRTFFATDD